MKGTHEVVTANASIVNGSRCSQNTSKDLMPHKNGTVLGRSERLGKEAIQKLV